MPRHRAAFSTYCRSEGALGPSAFGIFFEIFDGVADGENGFRRIVRNFAAELFFKRHHKFDRVEAVGAKVVDKAGVLGHLVGLDAQMLHDNLLNPLDNITHFQPLRFGLGSIGKATEPMASSRTRREVAWSRADRATYPPTKNCPSRAWVRLTYFIRIDQRRSALESAAKCSPAQLQIMAIPPFTCSVWPVT